MSHGIVVPTRKQAPQNNARKGIVQARRGNLLPLLLLGSLRVSRPTASVGSTPRFAYATFLIGPTNETSFAGVNSLGHHSSRDQYLNRTICFQQRIRQLEAKYPLVVLHDYEMDLSIYFDRTFKVEPSLVRKADLQQLHLNKVLIWKLVEFERVVCMDSDIYLRRLPDPLFTLPLSAPIAATPGCTHGDQWFAGGFLVLTPSEMVAAQMLHALDTPRILATYPRHTCTGPFFDDQRFLNGFFKGNYTKLDRRWNFATHYSGRPIGVDPDVNIHFTGRNKPAWHNCQHGTYDLKTSPKALLIAHKALNTST